MAGNPFAKSAPAAKKAGKAPFPAVKAAPKGLPAAPAGMPSGFKKGGTVKAKRGC